jgi:arabinofuranan 3-O-arabinosyltransferase
VGVDQIGEVEAVVGDRRERHRLDAAGRIVLDEPVVTDGLVLSFPGPDVGAARRVGVAEVEVPALFGRSAATPDRSATIELTCGEGPELRIDGAAVATRSTTTAGALLDGTPVRWESCEPVDLPAGSVRIDAARGALFASTIRLLPAEGLPAPTDARSATVERWEAEDRRVALDAGPATIVATTENANDGWTATFDGEPLTAIRIDGWRQGWLVPEGAAGQLELRYGPGQIQRGGLLLGALAIVALVGAAAAPSRWRGSRSGAGRAASSVEPLAPRPTGRRTSGLLVASSVGAAFALAPLGGVLVLAAIGAGRIVPGHGPVRWALRAMPVLAAVGAGAVAFAGAGAGLGTSGGTFSAAAQVLAATAIGAVGAVGALRGVGAAEPERAEGAGGEAQAPTGG